MNVNDQIKTLEDSLNNLKSAAAAAEKRKKKPAPQDGPVVEILDQSLKRIEERLAAMDKKMEKLEIIESHLLDVLLPHRKKFMSAPTVRRASEVPDAKPV